MKYLRSFFPLSILLFAALLFFYQVVAQGKIPIAADTIVGLYNPFRDFYFSIYPNGIPFKNFLVTDPVRQQFPWRVQSVEALGGGTLPVWNPYSGSGTPLLANFQTGAFYPLNVFFFVLPFVEAWTLLVVTQVVLCLLFMYLYLRFMKLNFFACIIGAVAFAFSGFCIAWLEWNTIVQTILWVPLIFLAIEYYLKKREKKWLALLLFSACSLIFAGHLQTAFYSLLLIITYLFARVYQIGKSSSFKKSLSNCFVLFAPFFLTGVIIVVITAIQWIPTLQLISHSARAVDQLNWRQDGWFLPWQNLIQFVAPDFFGNPSTLNYWGVWNYAEFVGYVGIVPLIMVLYALFFRRDKKTLFFGAFLFISLIFSLPTALAKLPYVLSVPFFSTTQPTRLLFLTDFSLVILCVLGMDLFLRRKRQVYYPLFVIGFILACLWVVSSFFFLVIGMTPDQATISRNNLKLPSLLFALAAVLLLLFSLFKNKYFQHILLLLIMGLTLFDLIRFGWKFTPFTERQYLFPVTKSLAFLQKDDSKFRIMTTDSRIFPPNFSSMYKLESVDIYDPLYLKRYGQFIAAMERGVPNIDPPFGFNRIVTPHNINSPLANLLNVKYVLTLSDISSERYTKVFQEGTTRVFENTENLPRAYFVQTLLPAIDEQDAINKLFQISSSLTTTAIVEGISATQIERNTASLESDVSILSYSPNTVILSTKNDREAFLVLLDTNFPQWKATIRSDSTTLPAKIYQTNFLFRGIFVPKGEHTVTFSTELL